MLEAGIGYKDPEVIVLNDGSLGAAEFAGRTAYDSFDKSENESVKMLNEKLNNGDDDFEDLIEDMKNIESSELLKSLAWVYHHHSVIEHVNITFLVRDISRAVLQELARHRIASYTVRSTRYTMGEVINSFLAAYYGDNTDKKAAFSLLCSTLSFLITDEDYNVIEHNCIYDKLMFQMNRIGEDEFLKLATSKDMRTNGALERRTPEDIFEALQLSKGKRNVGDPFKHIVSDNWSVDLVMTMNLRSLKNFFDLRDSGAAFFQIRKMAQSMKEVLNQKYLDLVVKSK